MANRVAPRYLGFIWCCGELMSASVRLSGIP
ncbi:hypothetical protein CGRA01v4_00104 [Colletotrichum graminicola]|nr:hypothetical protein CGRA01v4_00104 [Colletotrichum graminicola]